MTLLHVLVTGANGFVGSAVCAQALARGMTVRGAVRRPCVLPAGAECQVLEGLGEQSDWRAALAGIAVVVHAAARVHVMAETAENPIAEFRRINMNGTLNLARQAAKHGVRRFIFISSIGVNGAETFARPFSAGDIAAPHSPYAISKHEAELALKALAAETGLEVVLPGVLRLIGAEQRTLRAVGGIRRIVGAAAEADRAVPVAGQGVLQIGAEAGDGELIAVILGG